MYTSEVNYIKIILIFVFIIAIAIGYIFRQEPTCENFEGAKYRECVRVFSNY
jgi:hypothetical protein